MAVVALSVAGQNIKELEGYLTDEMIPMYSKELAQAANRAMDASVTYSVRGVASAYRAMRVKEIRAGFRVIARARGEDENPTAIGQWRGRPIPLYQFRAVPRSVMTGQTTGGVSALLKKTENFRHAFIARMKSGHTGVFERTASKRNPIDEMFGPSVPQMVDDEDILEPAQKAAEERFSERFLHAIDYNFVKKGAE
jgi:hypothetical protein